jgi:chemotaxis protein CheX
MMADHCTDTRWIEQLDGVVADVFNIMLQQSCEVVEDPPAAAAEIDIAAKILLSGTIDAQCLVEFPQATAKKLTDALLGSQDDWDDALIEDAIGELCNMIAGGWKSKLRTAASTSGLSVPVQPQDEQDLRLPQLAIHRISGHPRANRHLVLGPATRAVPSQGNPESVCHSGEAPCVVILAKPRASSLWRSQNLCICLCLFSLPGYSNVDSAPVLGPIDK